MRSATHIKLPNVVQIKNFLNGISSMPAGTEIKVLIPGTNRPQKTKETPYLSNHLLLLIKSLEEIPRYFPFLSKKFESLFSFTNPVSYTHLRAHET